MRHGSILRSGVTGAGSPDSSPLAMEECSPTCRGSSLGLQALNTSLVASGAPCLWYSTRAFLPDFQYFFFLFPIPLKDAGQMGPRHKCLFSFEQQLAHNTGVGRGSQLSLSLSFILFLSEKSREDAKQLIVFIMV